MWVNSYDLKSENIIILGSGRNLKIALLLVTITVDLDRMAPTCFEQFHKEAGSRLWVNQHEMMRLY
jgi:hypothetical protein